MINFSTLRIPGSQPRPQDNHCHIKHYFVCNGKNNLTVSDKNSLLRGGSIRVKALMCQMIVIRTCASDSSSYASLILSPGNYGAVPAKQTSHHDPHDAVGKIEICTGQGAQRICEQIRGDVFFLLRTQAAP